MRLPWLQIDADGMTRGEMLGRLLGIGPHAGVGVALAVWRWALEMAPDGDFSGGPHDAIALSAGVGIDDPRLVDELSRCGLLVVVADAGLVPVSFKTVRVRGLDRYKRAWEKNKRRKPALVVPVTGANPARTGAEPARKTETETEKKDFLVPEAPKPPKPRKLSAAEEFFAWASARRGEKTRFTDEAHTVAAINAVFGRALVAVGRPQLEQKYLAYLDDPGGASKEPPWPWRGFAARYHSLKAPAPQTQLKVLTAEERRDLYGAA